MESLSEEERQRLRHKAKEQQETSRRYLKTGWSPKEIMLRHNLSERAATRFLMFGRFLAFLDERKVTVPPYLTEDRFRGYWEFCRPKKGEALPEEDRFLAVIACMDDLL
jgi:hypothetical protein